jgi:catechol 2,3-dioxygenase-like lactoylglutathione lyase family enzyme
MRFAAKHFTVRVMVLVAASAGSFCEAQTSSSAPRVVTGGMNAEFTVSSQENSIRFYQDVLGLYAPAARVNPALPGVGQLTGTITGAAHVARMPIPGASWVMEIVETTGVDRKPVAARRQDVGAAGLILYVRDLDLALAKLKASGAAIVSMGGVPVNIGGNNSKSRAILAKDIDGSFFIEMRQMDPPPQTSAPAGSNVIGARMALTIADREKTVRYWSKLLDFDVTADASFTQDKNQLALQGTPGAQVRKTIATYPGTDVVFEFLEFKNIDRKELRPRTQDPGSGAFAITCRDMAALVRRLKDDGQTKILTVGNDALNQGARVAMFFQEPNGFILEAIQRIENASGKQQ